jgi:hypothetical protein
MGKKHLAKLYRDAGLHDGLGPMEGTLEEKIKIIGETILEINLDLDFQFARNGESLINSNPWALSVGGVFFNCLGWRGLPRHPI